MTLSRDEIAFVTPVRTIAPEDRAAPDSITAGRASSAHGDSMRPSSSITIKKPAP
jgi:hypothetical protein